MDFATSRRLLRRWAWLLVLCPLVAALAAGVISRAITPIYEGTAAVLVRPAQPLNTDTGQTYSGVTSTSDQISATYAQLMTQPSVLNQVISDLHLHTTPGALAGKVKVTPQSNTTVLEVTAQDPDPKRASAIANQVVTDFTAAQKQLRQQQTGSYTNSLQAQAQQLQSSMSDEQAQIGKLNAAAAQRPLSQDDQGRLSSLQQQLSTNNTQYQDVTSRLGQIQAQAALTSDSVVVVSAATVPSEPVSPKILVNVLLAAAGGLLLGVGLVLLLHRLDQTVKDDDELSRRTGLVAVGHIPFTQATRGRMGELVALAGKSTAAEAYRTLRTNLLFGSVDRTLKTIVVTSAAPEEGKSRTAANLAIVLAAAGHATLVVDADFRRPSMHSFFGRASKRGLTDLIVQPQADVEDLIRTVPEVPGLSVLASGPSPPNPSELLGSRRLTAILADLGSRFDCVVLDTPPLNAVTDPALVAANADATILVVEQGRTTYGALLSARQQLDNVGARVLGVVVNKQRETGGKYGYPAYRYYGREATKNAQEVTAVGEAGQRTPEAG